MTTVYRSISDLADELGIDHQKVRYIIGNRGIPASVQIGRKTNRPINGYSDEVLAFLRDEVLRDNKREVAAQAAKREYDAWNRQRLEDSNLMFHTPDPPAELAHTPEAQDILNRKHEARRRRRWQLEHQSQSSIIHWQDTIEWERDRLNPDDRSAVITLESREKGLRERLAELVPVKIVSDWALEKGVLHPEETLEFKAGETRYLDSDTASELVELGVAEIVEG